MTAADTGRAHRIAALVRLESLYVRRLIVPPIVYLVLPFVLMAFLREAMAAFFIFQGDFATNGAEFVVPAQAVLFGYMATEHAGLWIYAEHSWRTWDRVRATPATTGEVLAAKGVFWSAYLAVQLLILLVGGGLVFDLHVRGSVPALTLVMLANLATTVAFGFCGVALCPSQATFDAWTYGGALLMAAVGGAITPERLLPEWARAVSPASPVTWAMRGAESAILTDDGIAGVGQPCLVLLAFAAGFALLGWWRFDPSAAKLGRSK